MEGISITTYLGILCLFFSVLVGFLFLFAFSKKIGLWGIFSKAGEKEWKAIVPIYNQIKLLKICKLSPWFIILHLSWIVPFFGYIAGRDISWISIIAGICTLIYRFVLAIRLGEAFKKGDVFSFFLAFFPSILYPVLGCSKNESFTEPKEIKKEEKVNN